jgi:hypothetical protein
MKRLSFFLCVSIAAAVFAVAACEKKGPIATVDVAAFDFGNAEQNSQVSHTYILKNTGDQPLEIARTRTTCGCTVAQPSKMTLARGETSNIDVTFSTGSRTGKQEKRITVETNDPKNPKTVLVLTGNVMQRLTFDPDRLHFDNAEPGQDYTQTVTIANAGKEQLDVKDINIGEKDSLTCKAEFNGKAGLPISLKEGEKATLTFTLRLPADKPYFHTRVDFETAAQGKDPKTVTYYVAAQSKNAQNGVQRQAAPGSGGFAPAPASIMQMQKVKKPEPAAPAKKTE